jgi:hypothetical protein
MPPSFLRQGRLLGRRVVVSLASGSLVAAALGLTPGAWSQTPPPPAVPGPARSTLAPGGATTAAPDPTVREQELLERIRALKTPRLRSYGDCRYDWGAWRLNGKGVRTTGSDCGEPPIRGSVAVYCDTLQINRRVGEGPWEGWRLPFTAEESPVLGGEDRLVAALCANVRNAGSRGKTPSAPPLAGP